MIYDILNFLTGYVYIKIEGVKLERLLNSNITFWNVNRKGYGCIYANVSYMAYKHLIKNREVGITLLKERGIFCIAKNLFKNKILFFGMCVCILGLTVLSQMLIDIEISGYYSLDGLAVKEYVKEYGVSPFTFKNKVDLKGLTDYLKTKDNIAWASAGYDGVVLNVVIIEQLNEDDDTPCDIISDRQAVIKKIDVYSGIKNRQIGDVVSAGEPLVMGARLSEDGGVERIKARADVVGTFWLEGSYTMEGTTMEMEKTGNKIQSSYIDFWGNKAMIENEENNFKHYISQKEEKVIGGTTGILPIKHVSLCYEEVKINYLALDVNAVMEKAAALSFEKAVQQAPINAKIVNTDTKFEMTDGKITASTIVEIEADIGVAMGIQ